MRRTAKPPPRPHVIEQIEGLRRHYDGMRRRRGKRIVSKPKPRGRTQLFFRREKVDGNSMAARQCNILLRAIAGDLGGAEHLTAVKAA